MGPYLSHGNRQTYSGVSQGEERISKHKLNFGPIWGDGGCIYKVNTKTGLRLRVQPRDM